MSGGQFGSIPPGQFSALSQTSAAARHTTSVPLTVSGGHAALLPVQASALMSQPPATKGLQTTPASASRFVGQVNEEPLHVSAGSHGPRDGLHTTPELTKLFVGHAADVPVQYGTSQGPAEVRH